jgi:hypothetical protein
MGLWKTDPVAKQPMGICVGSYAEIGYANFLENFWQYIRWLPWIRTGID